MSGKFSFRAAMCVIALLGSSVIGVGTPPASAAFYTTVAQDSFQYGAPASVTTLNVQNGGTGAWGSAWTAVAPPTVSVVDAPMGGLSTSSPGNVTINGGSRLLQIQGTGTNLAYRDLSTAITGSVQVGFQFQFHGGSITGNDFLSIWLEDQTNTGDHSITSGGHLQAPQLGLKANLGGAGPANSADLFARTSQGVNEQYAVNIATNTSYYLLAQFDKIGVGQMFYNQATLSVYNAAGQIGSSVTTTKVNSDVKSVSRIGIRGANLGSSDVLYVDSLSVSTPAVAVVPVPPALALLASGIPFALVYLRRRKTA